ncbi:MAG: hypothetical protein IPM63_11040 [Acidobacteriota bacterium]|nr:MAG: hypothetical protein IPM63_11040 [Acidobacteriota bacterium]
MRIKKIINTIAAFALLAGSLVTLSSTVAAQRSGGPILDEKRPFDFADKYYGDHGVDPAQIIDRRSGFDRYSVFDYINSDVFRGVRILETRTGYDENGKQIFWVFYGYVDESGFTRNTAGEEAIKAASNVPVYFFPSAKFKGRERQAAMIDRTGDNPDKNPLGLGTAVEVEYTRKAYTKEGQRMLSELLGNNGKSLDGLPIIRTPSEIGALTRYELITQRARSIAEPGAPQFVLALTIDDPRFGAISPDAFLAYTEDGGKPIDAESAFFEEFDCLQKSGRYCREK